MPQPNQTCRDDRKPRSEKQRLVSAQQVGKRDQYHGGDQAAGAVGNGVVSTGILSSTIGTSGVLFAFTDEPVLDPKGRMQSFCHAVPGKWHVMGVTQGAGLSLRWFRDNFGGSEMLVSNLTGIDPYVLLDMEAGQAPVGSEGLLFLPYLMGERAPHLDPDAKRYEQLSFTEAIEKQLGVMDLTALTMCMENNLPVIVFDFKTPGNIRRVMAGEDVGTLVTGRRKSHAAS